MALCDSNSINRLRCFSRSTAVCHSRT